MLEASAIILNKLSISFGSTLARALVMLEVSPLLDKDLTHVSRYIKSDMAGYTKLIESAKSDAAIGTLWAEIIYYYQHILNHIGYVYTIDKQMCRYMLSEANN